MIDFDESDFCNETTHPGFDITKQVSDRQRLSNIVTMLSTEINISFARLIDAREKGTDTVNLHIAHEQLMNILEKVQDIVNNKR